MENCKTNQKPKICMKGEDVTYTDKNTGERKTFHACYLYVTFEGYRAVRFPLSTKSDSDKWVISLAAKRDDCTIRIVRKEIPYRDKFSGEAKSFNAYAVGIEFFDFDETQIAIVINSEADKFLLDLAVDPVLVKK